MASFDKLLNQTLLHNHNGRDITGGDIGAKIPTNSVQFDTTPTAVTPSEGLLQWNATDGTLDLGMSGGAITQQIGQELFMKVRNVSGSTIPNGSPVYVSGRTGNRPNVYLAKSDADATSVCIGLTTQDITSPADGFVTTFGYVRQIKTDYSGAGNWGTTWIEGDKLYISKTVAGQLTNVEPAAPHHSDVVATVEIVGGAGIGSLLVNINQHKTVAELSDVDGSAPDATGDLLSWNQSTLTWERNAYNISNYLKLDGSNDPITGNITINTNSTTTLLVEQDGVKDNVLVVDTTNGRVGINKAPTLGALDITGGVFSTSQNKIDGTSDQIQLIVQGHSTQTTNLQEWQNSSGTVLSKINGVGNVGVRMGATALTAYLHLAAGTTAASTAPLKFTAGPLMTAVEEGAMEFKGHTLYMTTFQVRRSVVLAQEVPIADVTATAATETTVYTIPMAANYLTAGKHIDIELFGIFSSIAGPNGVATVRLKYAGATITTFTTVAALNTNSPFECSFNTTCRVIGSGTTGKMLSWSEFVEGATSVTETTSRAAGALTNIDTTVDNTITVTVQFAAADAGNSFTVQQGHTLCIDANT